MLYIITFYAGVIFGVAVISFCKISSDGDKGDIHDEYDGRKR